MEVCQSVFSSGTFLGWVGVVRGLFTEELEEELTDTPPKTKDEFLICWDPNEPRKNTDKDLMNL